MAMGFWTKDGEHIDDTESAAEFSKREAALWSGLGGLRRLLRGLLSRGDSILLLSGFGRRFCEGSDAKAADRTAMLRLADQIGMSPTGLAANGWKIADVEPVL